MYWSGFMKKKKSAIEGFILVVSAIHHVHNYYANNFLGQKYYGLIWSLISYQNTMFNKEEMKLDFLRENLNNY